MLKLRKLIKESTENFGSLKYVLALTNKCNLSCSYCYQTWKNTDQNMTKDVIDRFIKKLLLDISTYPTFDNITINFFGGEPTLNKDVVYYCIDKVNDIASRYNKNVIYTMDSNGLLIDDDFIKHFSNLVLAITLSLPNDHNKNRTNKRNEETFDKIVENVLAVSNYFENDDFLLSIRYNTHHKNIFDFENFVKLIKTLKINCKIDAANVDNYTHADFKNLLTEFEFLRWKATDFIDILFKHKFYVQELPSVSLSRQCYATQDVNCKFWPMEVYGCAILRNTMKDD